MPINSASKRVRGVIMKNKAFIIAVVMSSFIFTSSLFSEEGKYSDLKELLLKQQEIINQYISDAEKIKTAPDVVKMYTTFAVNLKKLLPMIKTLAKKYNKLAEFFQGNPPEELKPEMEKLKLLGQKMQGTMRKIAPFMNDPEVRKASAELEKVSLEIYKAGSPESKEPPEKEKKKD
jgi:hypothetical protein